jgi:hypothetical protein
MIVPTATHRAHDPQPSPSGRFRQYGTFDLLPINRRYFSFAGDSPGIPACEQDAAEELLLYTSGLSKHR